MMVCMTYPLTLQSDDVLLHGRKMLLATSDQSDDETMRFAQACPFKVVLHSTKHFGLCAAFTARNDLRLFKGGLNQIRISFTGSRSKMITAHIQRLRSDADRRMIEMNNQIADKIGTFADDVATQMINELHDGLPAVTDSGHITT